jgi:hypothetical protein
VLAAGRLLAATGRRADLAGLGVAAVGLDPSAAAIPVDERMRAADGIRAIGDITGKGAFTHVAMYQAGIALGIVFQHFAIAPMRGLSLRKGLIEAAKADVASLTAFEIGLFGWMALMFFVFFPAPHLHPDSPVYWFLMQIGMIAGFFTAWPVNTWLIRAGIKEAM